MKKIPILAIAILALPLCSCGGEKAPTSQSDSVVTTKVKEPQVADEELERNYSATIGDREYSISIRRYPDKQLPTVKDQLDQDFYDNSVEVTIMHNGQKFFTKTFRKEAFEDYLSPADRKSSILLGMAYDEEKSKPGCICLAAQVGQPGMGEGPAFTVEIPTSGGPYSIVKDVRQDTNAEERMGD